MQLVGEYRDWVNKNIPLNEDWDEEISHLIYLRELLHDELISGNASTSEVTKIDQKWQAQLRKADKTTFVLDLDRNKKPKTKWWWWIDRLDELSEKDLSTL